jgi:hypothetical protein
MSELRASGHYQSEAVGRDLDPVRESATKVVHQHQPIFGIPAADEVADDA